MIWRHQPLLLYGLSFLFGITFCWLLLIPILILAITAKARFLLALLVGLSSFYWFHFSHSLPEQGFYQGEGIINVESLSLKNFYGKPVYSYRAIFKEFKTEDKLYKNIPVYFSLNQKGPAQIREWKVTGKLIVKPNRIIFKPDLDTPWKAIKNTYNLAEYRFELKEKVKRWVLRSISNERAALLLAALATGEIDDRSLSFDFTRLGLSHLLAISGFHFAILAAIFAALLKPFLSPKTRAIFLIFVLGLTCLFLGSAPSVLRAFMTLFIFLLSPLIHEGSKGENSLGACLLILLLLDPFSAFTVGFQLSFLATGAILLFFSAFDARIKRLFPARDKKAVYQLNYFYRMAYVILSFLRQSVALNAAILFASFPVILYTFHQFPWISLFYNLFFPFFLSLSLVLLIFSIPLPFLHSVNSFYTNFILNLTHESSPYLDMVFYSHALTPFITISIITLIIYFGLHRKTHLNYN